MAGPVIDLERLRAATEDDVTAALTGSYIPEALDMDPALLLEFWNLMLDRFCGARDD